MYKDKIQFTLNIGTVIEYDGEYCYGHAITRELKTLLSDLFLETKEDELKLETVTYFKDKREFVSKVIEKRIKPFLNEEQANELCKKQIVKYFPKATEEQIQALQFDKFAGCYIKEKVLEDLVSLYREIQSYQEFVFQTFLSGGLKQNKPYNKYEEALKNMSKEDIERLENILESEDD